MSAATKLKELHAQRRDLLAQADAAFAANDEAKFEEAKASVLATNKRIQDAQFLLDAEMAQPVAADPERQAHEEARAAGKDKFKSIGDQMMAVVNASRGRGDPRLFQAAALGQQETVPADGGFLVQTDYSATILDRMYTTGTLLPLVSRMTVSGPSNSMKVPSINETSRADGSRWGGIRAYWASEASTITASQTALAMANLELKKVTALVYASEEMLQDSAALGQWIQQKLPLELQFKVEDAIYNGTGGGDAPSPLLTAPCTVSVAKETSQVAATINRFNTSKMKARLQVGGLRNAVWLVNQDCTPQFETFDFLSPAGTVGMNKNEQAQSISTNPFSMNGPEGAVGQLHGRPIYAIEYAATCGTQGDIMLADLSQYLLIEKGGIQAASSMHVQFLTDQMAFRFTYRVDGQSLWSSAITPYKGSNSTSPFVVLDTRS
jgi:HK97 family phage major capsid protein